jgi:hypothetical protein
VRTVGMGATAKEEQSLPSRISRTATHHQLPVLAATPVHRMLASISVVERHAGVIRRLLGFSAGARRPAVYLVEANVVTGGETGSKGGQRGGGGARACVLSD